MKRVENEPENHARIRAHLDRFSEDITSDHKPYGLHRPRQPEWFESPEKIVGVRKTRSPKFAVIAQDYYMDQAALFIRLDPAQGMSPYYTCAFLNSPVAFKVFSGIKTQGDQLQIDKSVLTRFPIPTCHAIDHKIISAMSAWLHVLGILHESGKAPVDYTLGTRIRDLVDGFFDRLVVRGGKEPLFARGDIDNMPKVAIADHLVKRRCIEGIENLESTVVDVDGLCASATRLLPSLEQEISRIASRVEL